MIQAGNIIKWIVMPIPIFQLSMGYLKMVTSSLLSSLNGGNNEVPDQFGMNVAGPYLIAMCISLPVYWILLLLREGRVLICFNRAARNVETNFYAHNNEPRTTVSRFTGNINEVDQDVIEEENRVQNIDPKNTPVRMNKVQKIFGGVQAVKNVSFGLDFGECFALLGVSGAGKTTLFKCITGEVYPTKGELTINGFDVTTAVGFHQARKQIGYCPQFDCIFKNVTVLEHLQIYAALKGIDKRVRSKLILFLIEQMDLKDYIDIRANTLSGGNKRKLSVSIAMLGNPPLIFLDEPSTGVDPQAKRFMWNILSQISTQRKKSAVVITTHSMEEAEALCTKMGIMVKGEFKCFGPATHIKDKFGTGYEIEFKIKTMEEQEL